MKVNTGMRNEDGGRRRTDEEEGGKRKEEGGKTNKEGKAIKRSSCWGGAPPVPFYFIPGYQGWGPLCRRGRHVGAGDQGIGGRGDREPKEKTRE